MSSKGYAAGIQTPFTPSRKAEWVDEFNDLLDANDYSRNRLTEKLVILGLEAWNTDKKNAAPVDPSPQSTTNNGITLKCDGFSSEQIALLETEEFQNIVHGMVSRIFEGMNKIENEYGTILGNNAIESQNNISHAVEEKKNILPIKGSSEKPLEEMEQPIEPDSSVQVPRPLPQKRTAIKRKASSVDALNFIRNTQLDD